ncbi:MAG: Gfo/Idh/MocA family oxidoreductase [Clostridia bacterium]
MKKVAILGYGGRGAIYNRLCTKHKDKYEVVGIIDNSPERVEYAKNTLKYPEDRVYSSLDEFIKNDKLADWLFVCTQDKDHIEHAIKALDAGYHLLLEKPIACTAEDCLAIEKKAKEKNLKVAVCHVLRYSAYYEKIKEVIDSGVLGKIIAIDQVENVAYWHQAHSFVRGDWNNKEESNPMIMAKCCHDLDLAVYLADSKCVRVTSQGQLNFFNKDNAPKGSTEYCLGGCKVKKDCPYDCEKLYIDPLKGKPKSSYRNIWPQSRLMADTIVTIPKLYEALKTEKFGKCVFHCDNNVVDYQVTTMLFENGINSTLTMTAFSAPCSRETRVRGSLGELVCDMENSKVMLKIYGKKAKRVKTPRGIDAHGGGDEKMVVGLANDSLKTDISKSVESHLIAFAAEESRVNDSAPVYLDDLRKKYE